MKRTSLIMTAALLLAPLTALASESLPTPTPTPKTLSASKQAAALARLQTRGAAEIERRLTSLQNALSLLQKAPRITDTDKATLTQQVQTEIDGLTALQTKLAADTKLADARTDVQSIITEYRVYGLLLPKIQIIAAADRLESLGQELQDLSTNLKALIAAAKTAGHDVDALEEALTDLDQQLATAKDGYQNVASQAFALTPSDYNADHKVLSTYRTSLAAAHKALVTARDDAKTIITGLKAFK